MIAILPTVAAAWRTYRHHAAVLSGYAAWMLIPAIVLYALSELPAHPVRDVLEVVTQIALGLLSVWVSLAIFLFLKKHEQPSAAEIRHAWWPYLFVSALQSLVVLGGLILFFIPGLIASVWFSFSGLELLFEGKRGLAALDASRALSRGRFWNVLAALLGGSVLILLLDVIVYELVVQLISASTQAPLPADVLAPRPEWTNVVGAVTDIVFIPVLMAYIVEVYRGLKK